MSDVTPPQAGWYADPENAAGERWWNGSGWSDHKRDATTAAPAAAEPAPAVAPAPAPAESGFTFGSTAPVTPRPDPYAPAPVAQPYTAQPYYAAPGTPYAPVPYGGTATGTSNTLAIVGLVLSIVGFFVGLAAIAGVIVSGFGLAQARQREAAGQPNSGRGLAMAGLIVGIVACVIGLIFILIYVVALFAMPTYY